MATTAKKTTTPHAKHGTPAKPQHAPARAASGGHGAGSLGAGAPSRAENQWTFLTNHSHVLICLDRQPDLRLRDVAVMVGITERAVQRIIADLEEAGVLSHERVGRRNQYSIHKKRPLRHAVEKHRCVGDLLALVVEGRS